jgi:6-phosphogluconolactonase
MARAVTGSPSMSALHGEVRVVDDVPAAFAAAVLEQWSSRTDARFSLVLSGGPTARRCYERLAAMAAATVDWRQVDVLMGDERCVAPDDPDANQRLVREALLDVVGPVGSFHPMSCDEGPMAYEALLAKWARLDLIHLGLGPDGHTASLFPDAPALDAPADRLVLVADDPHEHNPHRRMTLTYSAIARARLAVFTVSGDAKRAAFAAVRAGADVPAARVRAERVLWLVDPDAAG